ncbi:MAG: hypothetical protein KC553_15140 [Nitrospina sp.]|nr:hypothetical protein [Nitrospina sp.]
MEPPPNQPETRDYETVTRQAYGLGSTVFIGFDVLAEATFNGSATNNPYADLLLAALDDTTGQTSNTRSGAPVPLQLTLVNEGIATTVTAVVSLPAGSAVVEMIPNATVSGDSVIWPLFLDAGEAETFTLWFIPLYTNLSSQVDVALYTGDPLPENLYSQLSLTLDEIQITSLAEVQQAIDTIQAGPNNEQALQKAGQWLIKAGQFMGQNKWDKAYERLLNATDELKSAEHPTAPDIRRDVDWILWQTGPSVP